MSAPEGAVHGALAAFCALAGAHGWATGTSNAHVSGSPTRAAKATREVDGLHVTVTFGAIRDGGPCHDCGRSHGADTWRWLPAGVFVELREPGLPAVELLRRGVTARVLPDFLAEPEHIRIWLADEYGPGPEVAAWN